MHEERRFLFTLRLKIRWGDMDAVGHVNNAAYFTYMEQTRIEWFCTIGLEQFVNNPSEGPVIVNASCNYIKPIVYPAEIEVRLFAGAPRRSSFQTFYEIRDAEASELLYAQGSAWSVWVDHRQGKSQPLPPAIREILS